jgi:hypothetical protein
LPAGAKTEERNSRRGGNAPSFAPLPTSKPEVIRVKVEG